MDDMQKAQIGNMRAEGIGYVRIAKALNISENTVKSYCRRNGLTNMGTAIPVVIKAENTKHFCLCCGNPVAQNDKRKEKKFCSDKCRMTWWNSHRDKVEHKIVSEHECAHCRRKFIVCGKNSRKYCSHECYIADRFGGDGDE